MRLDLLLDPIWVKNPHTGESTNIAPLFDAMRQIGGEGETPQDLTQVVTEVIRMVNLTVHDPVVITPKEVATRNHDLYLLKDMFEAMSVQAE